MTIESLRELSRDLRRLTRSTLGSVRHAMGSASAVITTSSGDSRPSHSGPESRTGRSRSSRSRNTGQHSNTDHLSCARKPAGLSDRKSESSREHLRSTGGGSPAKAARPTSPRSSASVLCRARQGRIGPVENLLAVLVPELEIAREADALGRDMAPACSSPSASPPSSRASVRPAPRRPSPSRDRRPCAPAGIASPHPRRARRVRACGRIAGKFAARAVTITWPPLSRGMSVVTAATAFVVVDVVEDHEPRRVGLEPAQNRLDLRRVLARLLLRRGRARKRPRARRGSRSGSPRRRRARTAAPNSRPRGPGVFDREPRLADPAEPVQRPPDDRRALCRSTSAARKSVERPSRGP